jgi:HEAT repeat protein
MAQETNSTVKNLVKTLSSFNDLSRVEARKALEAIGKPAVPLLIEALKDPNNLTRWEAAKALGEIGDTNAAPALVEALEDEEFDVRWLAAKALIELNIKGLRPLFHALIEHADSVFLREGAHHVLHDLAKGGLRKYLAPVLIALEDMDPAVQVPMAASHALKLLINAKIV